jgi:hypothetical protein
LSIIARKSNLLEREANFTDKEVKTMKKVFFFLGVLIVLMMACSSSTDNTDKYFEPVEEQYKIIEVPIISEVN